jgi:hypothetical protein
LLGGLLISIFVGDMNIFQRMRFELFHPDAKARWGLPLATVIVGIIAVAIIIALNELMDWIGNLIHSS